MAETKTKRTRTLPAQPVPLDENAQLVNRLTQQLAQMQRTLSQAQQKALSVRRSLETRTQELMEARAALSLLLATLDSSADGMLAIGHFGRAMHYNSRFTEMWRIAPDKLDSLDESAVLAMQLAQVRDPDRFLAEAGKRKSEPEREHFSRVELADGRIFECHAIPQSVRGRRVGQVTRYRDVTDWDLMAKRVAQLEQCAA
jgi:PAS domain-containing protein